MPKKEFFHKGGNPVSGEVLDILKRYFSQKEIDKIERLGGRILISVSIPYGKKQTKNRDKIEIGDEFIKRLRELKSDKNELERVLSELSVKQLRELGKYVGYPLRTKSAKQEILDELISCFYGEDIWRKISDINKENRPTNKGLVPSRGTRARN